MFDGSLPAKLVEAAPQGKTESVPAFAFKSWFAPGASETIIVISSVAVPQPVKPSPTENLVTRIT